MSVSELEADIRQLKELLHQKEQKLLELKRQQPFDKNKLTNEEIQRFSRQIIIPKFGVKSQLLLKNASVLIVGAGGLGCPSSLHLAGAGLGHIGIVDYDQVELNNLHRQLLHKETAVGQSKVESARQSLLELNSSVRITTHCTQLDSSNALEILRRYDLILDCTDNVATRYLLNDACVLLNKPLVSGSALQLEGQLTVYNFNDGPCYRCLFPKPPPPEAVTNCGDGGVLGAITGVIGTLQSLEAIKIVTRQPGVLAGRLLLFDGEQTSFRNVKLRTKRSECDVCSTQPKIQQLIDYEQFCGAKATDKDPKLTLLDRSQRITVQDYQQLLKEQVKHVLVDVRSSNEFEICQLQADSINIPIKCILDNKADDKITQLLANGNTELIVVCRRGNDSQLAVAHLKESLKQLCEPKDIIGGLHAWTKHIDPEFPMY